VQVGTGKPSQPAGSNARVTRSREATSYQIDLSFSVRHFLIA
jgi:hypothetical protein